jgi:hypothetical protein
MAANPPCSPAIKEEKKLIEEKEAERRKRVVRRNSVSSTSREPSESDEWWHMDQVESFYRECSTGREDNPDPAISAAFKVWLLDHPTSAACMHAVADEIDSQRASSPDSRTLDLSGVQITMSSAVILSDVFTIEWGLRKLTLKECDLDEHVSVRFRGSFRVSSHVQNLKPLLHALLIPNSLHFLSVSSNRRLKVGAFKLISAYVQKVCDKLSSAPLWLTPDIQSMSLQFLDVSQNSLDKKAVEYLASALATKPSLVSLRMDDCLLRASALETLGGFPLDRSRPTSC